MRLSQWIVLFSIMLLHGCSTTSHQVDIEGRDTTTITNAEIDINADTLFSSRYPEDHYLVKLGHTQTKGEFEQKLTSNQHITLSSGNIYGPAELKHDLFLSSSYIQLIKQNNSPSNDQFYLGGGLSQVTANLDTYNGSNTAYEHMQVFGGNFIIGYKIHLNRLSFIDLSLSLHSAGNLGLVNYRAEANFKPFKHVELFAGTRVCSFSRASHSPMDLFGSTPGDRSDIHASYTGLSVGFRLKY